MLGMFAMFVSAICIVAVIIFKVSSEWAAFRRKRLVAASYKAFDLRVEEEMEVHCGLYVTTFVLAKPIAGISRIVIEGRDPLFTPGNRCVIFGDLEKVIILDRERNHGVVYEVAEKNDVIHSQLRGSVVAMEYRRAQQGAKESVCVETHCDNSKSFALHEWPGKTTLCPVEA